MSAAPLQQHWQDGACRLVLDRPAQGNALSQDLVAALEAALDDCAARGATLLVLEGAGRHFCTGFDLSAIATETDDGLLARFVRIELLLQRVARAPCPTVAVVRGRAVGAGADLFAACSHRLVQDATGFAFPGARGFGLVLGTRRLAARVGVQRAADWVGSARVVDEAEALATGLATARMDGDDPLQAARAAVQAVSPPAADGLLRQALDGDAAHDDACDLAALVRSAARPGLQRRVADYVAQQARGRARVSAVPPQAGRAGR